ncbi:MAG TPA: hypothetical protein VF263_02430, partial [Longimicrobiaceae bacterium]
GGSTGLGGSAGMGGASAGSANTPDFGGSGTSTESTGGNRLGGALGQVEERANDALSRGADVLESAAQRLSGLAGQGGQGGQGGAMGRAGDLASQAAGTMESTARYLRDNDVRALQGDLERMTREKPLQTLLVAVAAGWVLGKILR